MTLRSRTMTIRSRTMIVRSRTMTVRSRTAGLPATCEVAPLTTRPARRSVTVKQTGRAKMKSADARTETSAICQSVADDDGLR